MLARREFRLLVGDRIYFAFLAVLPFILAGLALLIPGDSGLARPGPGSTNAHEAIEILAAFNVAAVIIGTALTIRALVCEHRIFRREQEVGLSAPAYLTAKIAVYGLLAAVWTAVVVAIVIAVKGGPGSNAVLLHNATVELYVSVAVTAIVSAVIGLALSSLGKSLREVLPLVVLGDPDGRPVQREPGAAGEQVGPAADQLVRPGPVGLRGLGVHRESPQGGFVGCRRRDVDSLQRLVGVRHGDARAVRCDRGRVHPVSAALAARRRPHALLSQAAGTFSTHGLRQVAPGRQRSDATRNCVGRHEGRRCSPRREPPITVGLWRLKRLALPSICATHWTGVGAM